MREEMKKLVNRMHEVRGQFEELLKNRAWIDEARDYAKKQGKELQTILSQDADQIKKFVEQEKKNLEKIQKKLPQEVKKIQTFVQKQKKEFEGLLGRLAVLNQTKNKKTRSKKATKKAATKKKTSKVSKKTTRKKSSSPAS